MQDDNDELELTNENLTLDENLLIKWLKKLGLLLFMQLQIRCL